MEKKLRIMIVEDNALESLGISSCVKELGHDVVKTASSAATAIDFAVNNDLDCILMDINLSGDDGISIMNEIQKDKDIPFVFITGYSDTQTVERAAKLCPYGYLVKPVDINDIRTALAVAFKLFEEKKQLKQEISDTKRQLSERKLIERAKGILMDSFDHTESSAMAFMQQKSRKTNRKLVDIAKDIIRMKESIDF